MPAQHRSAYDKRLVMIEALQQYVAGIYQVIRGDLEVYGIKIGFDWEVEAALVKVHRRY